VEPTETEGVSLRTTASNRSNSKNNTDSDEQQFPLRRGSLSAAILNDMIDDSCNGNEAESCPKWKQVIQDDLGMAGACYSPIEPSKLTQL